MNPTLTSYLPTAGKIASPDYRKITIDSKLLNNGGSFLKDIFGGTIVGNFFTLFTASVE